MGLLDTLERGIEKAVRSAFSAGGARAVKPVEIAHALRQAMDTESFTLSEGHTVAPNDFTVLFSGPDFERARLWGAALATELCDEVIRHAQSQGYALPGSVRVAFHADGSLRPGRIEVQARLDDGASPTADSAPTPVPTSQAGPRPAAPRQTAPQAAAPTPTPAPAHSRPPRHQAPSHQSPPQQAPARPAHPEVPRPASSDQATVVLPRGGADPAPALEFHGALHPLAVGDSVLGRSAERADIVVPDSSVSREHLRLIRVGSTVTLVDLGSRNGVVVNGRRVDGSVTLREGDRITVGQTDLVFHATGTGRRRA